MEQETAQQFSESSQYDQPLLPVSPLLGHSFDPSKYSEKVRELNGEKTPILRQEFPPSIVQKSGNLVGESP